MLTFPVTPILDAQQLRSSRRSWTGRVGDIIYLCTTSEGSEQAYNGLQVQTGASLSGRSRLANATDCSMLPEVRWRSLTLPAQFTACSAMLLSRRLLRHPQPVKLVSGSILCSAAYLPPPVIQTRLCWPHCIVPQGSMHRCQGHPQGPWDLCQHAQQPQAAKQCAAPPSVAGGVSRRCASVHRGR